MLDELAVGLAHEHGGDQHIRVPACKKNWFVNILVLQIWLGPLAVGPVTSILIFLVVGSPIKKC